MTPQQRGNLARNSINRATELVCLVRDEGADTIGTWLNRLDRQALYGLTVTLAAMVPDDATVDELLAWIEWEPTPVPINPPCPRPRTLPIPEHIRRAHAAHERARRSGSDIPEDIRDGERIYQALRHAAKKRKQEVAA